MHIPGNGLIKSRDRAERVNFIEDNLLSLMASVRLTGRSLSLYKELKGSVLTDVVQTQRVIGKGAYGEVLEVSVYGRKCAGKKLHDIFFTDVSRETIERFELRILEECVT